MFNIKLHSVELCGKDNWNIFLYQVIDDEYSYHAHCEKYGIEYCTLKLN